jgi:hypothetical protein
MSSAGDRHACLAQLSHAGVEQGLSLRSACDLGGALAGEHVCLDHVEYVDRTAPAEQRHSDRADLTG